MSPPRKAQYQILARFIRDIIRDRFKRLAKDEMLSKFMTQEIDPALLVDHYLQAERECVDLAEIGLLELVDSEKLGSELSRAAKKIQENLQRVYGSRVAQNFLSEDLMETRIEWIRARMEFYAQWLSVDSDARNSFDLAKDAFKTSKNLARKLENVLRSDKLLGEGILKSTNSMFRLLMKKQLEHEAAQAKELWEEFIKEVFKEPLALPEI